MTAASPGRSPAPVLGPALDRRVPPVLPDRRLPDARAGLFQRPDPGANPPLRRARGHPLAGAASPRQDSGRGARRRSGPHFQNDRGRTPGRRPDRHARAHLFPRAGGARLRRGADARLRQSVRLARSIRASRGAARDADLARRGHAGLCRRPALGALARTRGVLRRRAGRRGFRCAHRAPAGRRRARRVVSPRASGSPRPM